MYSIRLQGWLKPVELPLHISVDVDDDLQSSHTQVSPHIIGHTDANFGIDLFIDVFELILQHGNGKWILLTHHFCSLFTDNVFIAFNLIGHLFQNNFVDLIRWDMT